MEIQKQKILKYFIGALILYFIWMQYKKKEDEKRREIAENIKKKNWYKTVVQEAKNYNVQPERIGAIIAVESQGNENARGPAGEFGLMQILPAAHKAVLLQWSKDGGGILGIKGLGYFNPDSDLMKPEYNILVGTTYLAILKKQFSGNIERATEAYNNGSGDGSNYTNKIKPYLKYFTT